MKVEHKELEGLEACLWEHRCDDGVGGCTAISATYLTALLQFIDRAGDTNYWRDEANLLLAFAGDYVDKAREQDSTS